MIVLAYHLFQEYILMRQTTALLFFFLQSTMVPPKYIFHFLINFIQVFSLSLSRLPLRAFSEFGSLSLSGKYLFEVNCWAAFRVRFCIPSIFLERSKAVILRVSQTSKPIFFQVNIVSIWGGL